MRLLLLLLLIACAGTPHLCTVSHTASQRLPLSATLLMPVLVTVPAKLDFGCAHPAAPKPMELLLTNPGAVEVSWRMELQQQQQPAAAVARVTNSGKFNNSSGGAGGGSNCLDTSKPKGGLQPHCSVIPPALVPVFSTKPCSGILPGRGLGVPHSQRVTVWFSPRGNSHAACLLPVHVAHGR